MKIQVIRLKDMLRYLVGACLVCIALVLLSRYFSNPPEEKEETEEETSSLWQPLLLACLDTEIPGIQFVQQQETPLPPLQETERKRIESVLNTEYKTVQHIQVAQADPLPEEPKTQEPDVVQTAQQEVPVTATTEVQPSAVPNKFSHSYETVEIKNETEYELTQEMLTPDIEVEWNKVLIFHTHTCESYTSSEAYPYTPTGNFRTTDNQYNVVRVGEELKNQLTFYGIETIHDSTYHDYPAYTGSYGRSLETVENILADNHGTDIVIDLHRDAIADSTYAPTVKIGEDYAARLMFVIGTDGGGLWHDNWNQNLKFAIKVQQTANNMYPGLFKPMIVRNSRYNQQLAKAACIIEVGATGNTLEQSLTSMKYLAKVLEQCRENSNKQ